MRQAAASAGLAFASILLCSGCNSAPVDFDIPQGPIVIDEADVGPTPNFAADTDFSRFKQLAEGVRQSPAIVLYEGLPAEDGDHQLYKSELENKPNIEINGFRFYKLPLTLTDRDAKQLTAIFCTQTLFRRYLGPKPCGGFHPDFCVEWQNEDKVYRALVCFGCDEIKWSGPETALHCDLRSGRLISILRAYRTNRPRSSFDHF